MEFHPNKCQMIRLTNKTEHIVIFKYNIHNVILQEFDSAKYLGVTIDSHLNWKSQCNNVSKKASFMLSFLERNFSKCPPKVKENLFNALVRPLLEYGCYVWDPYFDNQINRLEMINKRAARFITGNYKMIHGNTDKNMKSLGWSSLSQRRSKIKPRPCQLASQFSVPARATFDDPHENFNIFIFFQYFGQKIVLQENMPR